MQERQHGFGVDVVKPKIRDGTSDVLGEEHEKEPERVSVRAHGVLAGTTDPSEVIREEALH